MPVEIRELVVRAHLVDEEPGDDSLISDESAVMELKEEILAACEAMISDALTQTRER